MSTLLKSPPIKPNTTPTVAGQPTSVALEELVRAGRFPTAKEQARATANAITWRLLILIVALWFANMLWWYGASQSGLLGKARADNEQATIDRLNRELGR